LPRTLFAIAGAFSLIDLQLGSRESFEDWLDLARDLTARGLRCPAVIEGGQGGAVAEDFLAEVIRERVCPILCVGRA
jgi:hypothetical protein